MEITAVRIRLVSFKDNKLQAFACVALDGCFVIRDIKVISRPNGLFVAMPSRKLTFCCQRCAAKNHLRAKYCNACGARLSSPRTALNGRGRAKLFADVAHPITPECRELFHQKVLAAYQEELDRSRQPGYQPAAQGEDDAGPEMESWPEPSCESQPNLAEPAAGEE